MIHPPSRIAHAWYLGRYALIWSAIALGISRLPLPWTVSGTMAAVAVLFAFLALPRRYLGYSLETAEDGLRHTSRYGKTEWIPWSRVTHVQSSFFLVRLIDIRSPFPVLFGRPLLVEHGRALREEIARRCPNAVRIGPLKYWRIVFTASVAAGRAEKARHR